MNKSSMKDPKRTTSDLVEMAPATAQPQPANGDSFPLAMAFANRGVRILPYFKKSTDGDCSCINGKNCYFDPDPHPAISVDDATVNLNTITKWSEKLSDADLAIIIGKKNHLAILTIEGNIGAEDNFEKLQFEHGFLPKSMSLRSNSGDTIVFYNLPDALLDSDLKKENIAAFSGIHLQTCHGALYLSNLQCPDGVDDVETWITESTFAELPEWIVSLAIDVSASDVVQFPCEVFPAPIANFIREGADALSCPADFLGVTALVVLATAIGNSRQIEVKRDWKELPVIFAGIVAKPGSKKSPALQLVTKPLNERQKKLGAKFEQQRKEYEQANTRYLIEKEIWNDAFKKASVEDKQNFAPFPTKPEKPKREQIKTTDFTIEAIDDLLGSNPRGMICVCDELSDWVSPVNQRRGGKGGDRSIWQSHWNSAPRTVNRKSEQDPVELNYPFVSVVGCIPPGVLKTFTGNRISEDGFLDRLLLVMPDHNISEWSDSEIALDTAGSYELIIEELFKLEGINEQDGEMAPAAVRLTVEARRVFIEWYNNHISMVKNKHFPDNLRTTWNKLIGYTARFMLIIHMCRVAAGECNSKDVDCQSVEKAVVLVNYFMSHIRRIHASLRNDPDDRKVKAFLAFVQKHGGEVSIRQVQRSKVAGLKTSLNVREMFLEVEQRGYGEISNGKRNSVIFKLSSTVSKNKKSHQQDQGIAAQVSNLCRTIVDGDCCPKS